MKNELNWLVVNAADETDVVGAFVKQHVAEGFRLLSRAPDDLKVIRGCATVQQAVPGIGLDDVKRRLAIAYYRGDRYAMVNPSCRAADDGFITALSPNAMAEWAGCHVRCLDEKNDWLKEYM